MPVKQRKDKYGNKTVSPVHLRGMSNAFEIAAEVLIEERARLLDELERFWVEAEDAIRSGDELDEPAFALARRLSSLLADAVVQVSAHAVDCRLLADRAAKGGRPRKSDSSAPRRLPARKAGQIPTANAILALGDDRYRLREPRPGQVTPERALRFLVKERLANESEAQALRRLVIETRARHAKQSANEDTTKKTVETLQKAVIELRKRLRELEKT